MNDKYFLDTNILIYSIGNIIPKKKIAVNLIGKDAVISTQIITESANVMSRKLKYGYPEIRFITNRFAEEMNLHIITHHTIRIALDIAEKYGFSYYDSQVIACALESDCAILCSEDLQHNQFIENSLRIINPFQAFSNTLDKL
ncbi:PilT protein domain protein [Desulfamplus magnetovallimortis]|uniref:PilT protein domain protein n=1 Tax=Desulfamplus magnetovallimortis TaxID=1246637 RepID=A0A1W1H4U7_9BACT|nr:PIN domain-containing protein [Desulfamplus magnetovallimortis]SLM27462.1 PilT protein domain protein [Desulfamplus magnetovallimortis]